MQYNIPEKTYIGLYFEDVIDYIIAIISILKIRCVFVPIDKELPTGRIDFMLKKCKIEYIVCDEFCIWNTDYKINNIIYTWKEKQNFKIENQKNIYFEYNQEDPIYVYWTSGSTGSPKGVIGKNESLVQFLDWEIEEFSLGDGDKYTQLTSPSFDPFLREIFVPILSGGIICLFEIKDSLKKILFLPKWLFLNEISVVHCVPSIFHVITSIMKTKKYKLDKLKYIFLAGEKPVIEDLKLWTKLSVNKETKLINFYGPTETTLVKMFHEISIEDIERKIIPIGKPIKDARIYLFDNLKNETNFGEIFIETRYCSLGYINELDNINKFTRNPYDNTKILYKTGDLGKKQDNEDILFCGRIDRQIKIAGIGVNLDVMENIIINNVKEIKECCVVINKYEKKLICYYESKNEIKKFQIDEILQEYFKKVTIPKVYVHVNKIERNYNGKIDREYYSNQHF